MIDERLNFFVFCGVDNHALELVWGILKEIGGCENGLLGNESFIPVTNNLPSISQNLYPNTILSFRGAHLQISNLLRSP